MPAPAHRCGLRLAGLAAVSLLLGAAVLAPAAAAHSHGRAQLFLLPLTAQGHSGSVQVAATVIDADSGIPQPGYQTSASFWQEGSQPSAPALLQDMGRGVYAATLALGQGTWTIFVQVAEGIGSNPAYPTSRSFLVSVAEPGPITVRSTGTSQSGRGSGGGIGAKTIVALLAVVFAAALFGLWARGRQRRAVTS
jgi:hypothetical protein